MKQSWRRKNATLVDVIMGELGLPTDLTLGEVAGDLGGPLAETVAGAAGLSKMTGRDLVPPSRSPSGGGLGSPLSLQQHVRL